MIPPFSSLRKYRPGPIVAIVVVGVAARMVYLSDFAATAFFVHPVIDEATYWQQAADVAAGNFGGPAPFWQAPLVIYLLGFLRLIFGDSVAAARIVFSLIGSASVVLVFLIGKEIYGRSAGLVSAAIVALYGPLIYFDALLLPATPAVFLWLVFTLAVLKAGEKKSAGFAAFAGFAGGLAATAQTAGLICVPLLALWLYRKISGGVTRKKAAALAAVFVVAAAVGPAFVSAVNYAASGEVIVVSYNAGINYYIGNNPDADRTVALRPGAQWSDLTAQASRAGAPTPAARSSYFFARALDYAENEPGDFLLHQFKKFYRAIHGFERPRNVDLYRARDYSPLMRILVWPGPVYFPWGIVFVAGVLGLAVVRNSKAAAVAIIASSWLVGIAAFFVSARHRLPLVAIMCIPAGALAVSLNSWWKQAAGKSKIIFVAAGLVLMVIANLPADYRGSEWQARQFYMLGQIEAEAGNLANAHRNYEKATELAADFADAYNGLGLLATEKGDYRQAVDYFGRAIDAFPNYPEALANLGRVMLKAGMNPATSLEYLLRARQLNPETAGLDIAIARAYLQLGKPDEAIRRLDRSAEGKADAEAVVLRAQALIEDDRPAEAAELLKSNGSIATPQYYVLLARAYRGLDQPQAAIDMLQQATRLDSDNWQAEFEKANLLRDQNDCRGAIVIYSRLVEKRPAAGAYNNLGYCQGKIGRYREAAESFAKALESDNRLLEAALNLGGVLEYLGRSEEAAEAYTRALEIDPQNERAQQALQRLQE